MKGKPRGVWTLRFSRRIEKLLKTSLIQVARSFFLNFIKLFVISYTWRNDKVDSIKNISRSIKNLRLWIFHKQEEPRLGLENQTGSKKSIHSLSFILIEYTCISV